MAALIRATFPGPAKLKVRCDTHKKLYSSLDKKAHVVES